MSRYVSGCCSCSGGVVARGDGAYCRQGSSQLACAGEVSDLPRGRGQGHLAEHSCPPLETNVPDNFAVDGARDTVLQLEVHLGDGVLGKDRGVGDVTYRRHVLARCSLRLRLEAAGKEECLCSYE